MWLSVDWSEKNIQYDNLKVLFSCLFDREERNHEFALGLRL